MSSRIALGSALIPVGLAVVAAAAWWWQDAAGKSPPPAPAAMPWKHVEQQYPMPAELDQAPPLPPDVLAAIMAANPFSQARRLKPPADTATPEGGPATPTKPAAPQFVFKGLIQFGNRQRAILEDQTTRKTHFLEVGQEVAGFKVLDIAENRVVLSDPQTKEELVVSIASKASP
jgi:hypothetical protein